MPKLNKVPCLLFILKFKTVSLLNLKNHGTRVSKKVLTHYLYRCTVHFVVYLSNTPTNAFVGVLLKYLHAAVRTCEETVFSSTRFENRKQAALIFNFSGKFFFTLPC